MIPSDAIYWYKLNTLLLRNNKIKLLSGNLLRQWKELNRLALGNNNITNIPDDIGQCKQLIELDLS